MRVRSFSSGLLLAVFVAACGSGSGPTQGPGAATQNPATTDGGGGGATQDPGVTDDPGTGGDNTVDTTYGKVSFTITGPIEKTGEFGFIPSGSLFGGSAGSALNFADSSGSDASGISIIIDASKALTVSYLSVAGQVPGATCTTTDLNVGSNTASGKFECDAEVSITASGATAAGGHISGSFTAHT